MQFESRWEKQQRLKKTETFKCCRNDNSRDTLYFCLVLPCGMEKGRWKRKTGFTRNRVNPFTQQINEQQQRQKELEEYKSTLRQKKFVEEVAKNKFGLLYPDEILIKPDD